MSVNDVRFVTPGVGKAHKAVILDSAGNGSIPGTLTVTGGIIGNSTNSTVTNGTLGPTVSLTDGATVKTTAGNGATIAGNTNQKLGFWGATPIIQPSATGELVGLNGNAATAANATNMNSNGNAGATFYSYNDVVKALKQAGILKA